jgi:hypothetical protein
MLLKLFLAFWYYFWGDLISKPMNWFDFGFLYPLYNRWMCKSAKFDEAHKLWVKPKSNTKCDN